MMPLIRKALPLLLALAMTPASPGQTASTAPTTAPAPDTAQDTGFIPYGPFDPPRPEVVTKISPRTIDLIDHALARSDDMPRRVELVGDLARLKSDKSVAIVTRLLDEPSPLMRAAAVRALTRLDAARPPLLDKVRTDASPLVRREVVLAGLPEAIIAGVSDADASVRSAAVSVSVNDATDQAIADALDRLDPPLQAVAVRTLARRNATAHAPAVARLVGGDSVVVNAAALQALATLGAIRVEQLEPYLKHQHAALRTAAVRAASGLSDSTNKLRISREMLSDAEPSVRVPAATLLGEVGEPSDAERLAAQLPVAYRPLRESTRQAMIALARVGDDTRPAVERAAAGLLNNADAQRRIDGSYILGQLASREGLPQHIALLKDADWSVVRQAAVSLGEIGDRAAGPELVAAVERALALKEMTDTEPFDAGEQAILAAARIKYEPILPATRPLLANMQAMGPLRLSAIYAMGVLGEPDDVWKELRPMLDRTNNLNENMSAIEESIKAMGNARAKQALPKLRGMRATPGFEYAVLRALDRIEGTTTPFVQPGYEIQPDTTIRSLD